MKYFLVCIVCLLKSTNCILIECKEALLHGMFPKCKTIDFCYERPICQVEDIQDASTLRMSCKSPTWSLITHKNNVSIIYSYLVELSQGSFMFPAIFCVCILSNIFYWIEQFIGVNITLARKWQSCRLNIVLQ